MSRVAKRLYATDETFREVADLLFGGGADDLVSKLSPDTKRKQKKERRQAQVGLASNLLGIGAGAQGLYAASRDPKLRSKVGTEIKTPKFKLTRTNKALAAGAVGLQAANLGGDAITNVVLRREAKKGTVKKSEPGSADVHSLSAGKLKLIAAKKGYQKGKPFAEKGIEQAKDKLSKSITWEGEISKVDTDKRQVFGWASIVEVDGQPVVDLQGDYIDIDEIEKSAYEYVIKSRKGGDMHRRNSDDSPVHASDMIESFIVTPEKKEKLGLPDSMPTGWWVGYQINDDEAWNLVKSGKRTGFSIHGRGQRTPSEI
jgi:hypothetical protein